MSRYGWRWPLAAAAAVLAVMAVLVQQRVQAEEYRVAPPPVVDEKFPAGGAPATETAVLAGGCFWGVQGVFQHVKGVTAAVSGYTGGERASAQYETVSTGTTGHAESVRITYDPHEITYGQILRIYFSVAHDPTELNRQGPDEGTQYRSAIFPVTPDQARIARAYLTQLHDAHTFAAPVVTTVEPGKTFYPAETYHQNYLTLHPHAPYIVINDLPKIDALKQTFPAWYRDRPVLVNVSTASTTTGSAD
jgi:peptide-methionine (S)-S-oxide reductase